MIEGRFSLGMNIVQSLPPLPAPHNPTVMAARRRAVWAERIDGNDDVRHQKAVLWPGAPQCIKVRKSIRVSVSMTEAKFGGTGAHVNRRRDCQDGKNSSCGFHSL
jgi:hypothetical protein